MSSKTTRKSVVSCDKIIAVDLVTVRPRLHLQNERHLDHIRQWRPRYGWNRVYQKRFGRKRGSFRDRGFASFQRNEHNEITGLDVEPTFFAQRLPLLNPAIRQTRGGHCCGICGALEKPQKRAASCFHLTTGHVLLPSVVRRPSAIVSGIPSQSCPCKLPL